MAMGSAVPAASTSPLRLKRTLLGVLAGAVTLVGALAAVVLLLSGVSLATDATALARVEVQPLGGSIESVQAFGPDGRRVPLARSGDRLTPLRPLRPGEQVSVEVRVRRPGWIGWALGAERTERLTLRTPVASVADRWMTLKPGAQVLVRFDSPVSAIAYGSVGHLTHRVLRAPARAVSLGSNGTTGTVEVAAAARSWEKLGAPAPVSWFPPSREAVMASLPAPGTLIGPATPLVLTFSRPVAQVLGSSRPRLTPAIAGRWREADSHTLIFTPAGFGAPLGSQLRVTLPSEVAVTAGAGHGLQTTRQVQWTVPPGSTLRLQQLLAQAGYLPVDWQPSGAAVPRTPAAQAQAAVDPPSGAFSWRYGNTPAPLQALWSAGQPNVLTRGAVMKFESLNNLTADGEAGATVWRALLLDAIRGKRLSEPYSYVYVHREVPEMLTLWSAGRTVLSTPANTGITGAETALGTYPVFEHIPEGTMSGTNPDGSHYEDHGIKWISYFNGGDALHNFNRSSFGTPQSLGCVELPLAASAQVWPYTPIGTLVTIAG